jgi:DNA-binding MarR family transcriptional regulator
MGANVHDQTGAALIHELRAILRAARAATAPIESADGVPTSVMTVLGLLDSHDGLRQTALARALGVDASVTSRHVAAALERGLVERRPDPVDGRACLISLTAEGRRVLLDRRADRLRWLAQVMSDWDDVDALALLNGLRRLHEDVIVHAAPVPRRSRRPLAAAGSPTV